MVSMVSIEDFKELEQQLAEKTKELTDSLINLEKIKSANEQQAFLFEKKLTDISKSVKDAETEKLEWELKAESCENQISDLRDKLKKSNQKAEDLSKQLKKIENDTSSLSMHSSIFLESIDSRDKLISDLKTRVSTYENQISELQSFKADALKNMEDLGRMKRQTSFKDQVMEQEKSLLQNEIKHLQGELEQRSQEVLSLHRNHSSTMLSMQSQMSQLQEKEKSLVLEKQSLSRLLEEKTAKVEELMVNLSESREAEMKLDASFRHELITHEKLCGVYKNSADDYEKRCSELESSVEELRALLEEASEHYGALELAKKDVEAEAQAKIDSQNDLIHELKEESEKINKALNGLMAKDTETSETSQAVAAVTKVMEKGLTLSQLYSEYMSTVEQLFTVQEENKSLNKYVAQVLQEVEENQPTIKKQKEDYEESLQTINTLNDKLHKTNDELLIQKKETTDTKKELEISAKLNKKSEQKIQDLSKQLTTLLMRVESLKSGEHFMMDSTCAPYITCASDVIDHKLLTFNDVAELQSQNMKLVSSIRELTDQMEANERNLTLSHANDIKEELDMVHGELAELREKNLKLQSSLLKISTKSQVMQMEQSKLSAKSNDDSFCTQKSIDQKEMELQKLKELHSVYKEKMETDLKSKFNKISELESAIETLRMEKVKLLTQAEYNEERIKAFGNNGEVLQRQVTALESKCHALQASMGRHEGVAQAMEDRNQELSKQLSHAQAMIEQLKEEKIILKNAADKLMSQQDEYLDSRQSQNMILSNLEVIKLSLDKNSSDVKNHLEMQVYELSRQCSQLQAKVESKSQSIDSRVSIATLQESLEKSRQEAAALRKELENRKTPSTLFTRDLPSPIRPNPKPDQGSMITSRSEELEVELSESKAKIDFLLAKINSLEDHLSKMKELCSYQEDQLSKATEANVSAEKQLDKVQKTCADLEEQKCLLEDELTSLKLNEQAWKTEFNHKFDEVSNTLKEKEELLIDALKAKENAEEARKAALEDLHSQTGVASVSQDKYEKEVMLHSADLQALNELKDKFQAAVTESSELKHLKEKRELQITEQETKYAKKEEETKEKIESLTKKVSELESHNESLLTQFTELSSKMSIPADLSNTGDESEDKADVSPTNRNLHEVIGFLRKEKEIYISRVNTCQMETERLRTQKKNLESQMEVLQKSLLEQQQKCQELMDNPNLNATMTRKIETVDALSDSNRLLRDEKQVLQTSLEELSTKCAQLESNINPLQDKIRGLTSKLDTLVVDKKGLQDERELYKNRCQELVEKLNKANPDDLKKLQKDLKSAQSDLETKNIELTLLRSQVTNLQKTQQAILTNKNQLQIQLNAAREELKSAVDDSKKFSQEKIRYQQQSLLNVEKNRLLELSQNQALSSHRTELQNINSQVSELIKKDELSRNINDALKRENELKGKKILEIMSKNETLEKQVVQLRRIALKYKGNDKIKELEKKVSYLTDQLDLVSKSSAPNSQAAPETSKEDPQTEDTPEIPPQQISPEKVETADAEEPIENQEKLDEIDANAIDDATAQETKNVDSILTASLGEAIGPNPDAMELAEILTGPSGSDIQIQVVPDPESRKRKCSESEEDTEDVKKPRIEETDVVPEIDQPTVDQTNVSTFSPPCLESETEGTCGIVESTVAVESESVPISELDSNPVQTSNIEEPSATIGEPEGFVVTSSEQEPSVNEPYSEGQLILDDTFNEPNK